MKNKIARRFVSFNVGSILVFAVVAYFRHHIDFFGDLALLVGLNISNAWNVYDAARTKPSQGSPNL